MTPPPSVTSLGLRISARQPDPAGRDRHRRTHDPGPGPAAQPLDVEPALAVIWFGLLAIALVGGAGRDLYFLATGAVVAAVLVWVLAGQRFPSLLTAFQVGFVVIISVEGVFSGDALLLTYGAERFGMVSRYLVASLSIVSLVHLLAFRSGTRPTTARTRAMRPGATANGVRERRSLTAIMAGSAVYMVGIYPRVLVRVTSGRITAFEPWFAGTALEPLVTGVLNATGMLLPAAIMFHVVRIRGSRPSVAVAFCTPFLLVQFAIGTRYPLLFAVAGMVVVATANARLRTTAMLRTLLLASVVFVASSAMTQFRSVGLGNSPVEGLSVSTDRIAEGERTIENLSEITAWFDQEGYRSGASSLTVTFFFVPRTFWPDKPEAMGYWFPRRYGAAGFSEGHSIAYSFAGDPYADFGYGGGLLAVAPLGLALALLDRWRLARFADPTDPRIVVAAPLYGAAFFAVRSVDTAVIATCFIFGVGLVYVRLVSRSRHAGRAGSVLPPAGVRGRASQLGLGPSRSE